MHVNVTKRPTGSNWFTFNVFNSFDFIDFVLVSFPLYLFWTYIFLAKNGTDQFQWGNSITTFAHRGERGPLKCKRMKTRREEGVISMQTFGYKCFNWAPSQ